MFCNRTHNWWWYLYKQYNLWWGCKCSGPTVNTAVCSLPLPAHDWLRNLVALDRLAAAVTSSVSRELMFDLQNNQDKWERKTFQILIQHDLQIMFLQHQITLQEYHWRPTLNEERVWWPMYTKPRFGFCKLCDLWYTHSLVEDNGFYQRKK